MESLIFIQEDVSTRIAKAKSNFKKSPKDRLNKDYVETRLQSLENLWAQFVENHRELLKAGDPKVLKASSYIENDVYSETEEVYVECKCFIKAALSSYVDEVERFSECNSGTNKGHKTESNAKLPKIIIPMFSGKYSEWSAFRDLYLSLVHKTEMESIQKMQYLKGLLSGEAEQLVRHISLAEGNYMRCWNTLETRYNNKRYLCNTILKRLFAQPNASTESANFIRELLDTTSECLGALSSLGVDVSNWDIIIVYITALRLDHESRKQWELQSASSTELPTWEAFEQFLTNRFRALEFVDSGSNHNQSKSHPPTKSFHVAEESNKTITCKFCKEPHRLAHCSNFVSAEVQTRRSFVEKNNLCFNCLGDNHRAHQCRSLMTCRVCQRRHHTYLHPTSTDPGAHRTESAGSNMENVSGDTDASVVCFASGGMAPSSQVLLATALVRAQCSNGNTRMIRALLDQGSQASFVTEATAQYLGLKRTPVRGVISGLGGCTNVSSNSMVNITIKSIYDHNITLNLNVYVLKSITTLLPSKELVATDWVLDNIPLADPKYGTPNKIDILLGAAVYGQVVRDGVKKNAEGTLLAQNTTLGWILSGIVSNQEHQEANLISMHSCVEDIQLKRFWELEADPITSKKTLLTDEEARCERLFSETTARDQEGRYIVRLPFKTRNPDLKFENSKRIAERRLNLLVTKLGKSNDMKAKYTEVIEEYVQLGHMEVIPEDEVKKSNGVYLSHFAVIRNDKDTSKVRIVFDASCKGENGVSLNDLLMVGPTLQPELRHLLMSWRSHRICLSADIVKMYRQVKVATEDVDFQRILWKKDQLAQNTEELRLLRITFGTASAPYLAVKALQQLAQDEGANYPVAAGKVISDFYMDDLLTGCEDIETAMQMYREMNDLLLKGGFVLQKWSSNCEELLEKIRKLGEGIGEEEGFKLKEDEVMKLLGLTWNRKNDAFQYTVTLPQLLEPITKRKIVSDIARLFDPLGWVAPSVIVAKAIIQKLWIARTEWDEIVPSKILEEWLSYRNDLPNLLSLQIPRWIQTAKKNLNVELHGFSDASKIAYAAAVYMRVVDETGCIHVNLVTAKTKVAPIKQVSIPRLELCGAVLLTRLLVEVAEVMKIKKKRIHAWTDSTVVLAWLNNHPSRWHTFVANRVSEILTTLDAQQWSYIRSRQNPADCASRGLKPKELIDNSLWFKGPEVLHTKEVIYKRLKNEETSIEEITVHLVTKQEEFWERFSNLGRMIRVIAYCRRFLSGMQRKQNKNTGFLTTLELKEAMNTCIRECQREHFNVEIAILENDGTGVPAKLKGPLKSLNPYIDDKKILRVGGRLESSSLTEDRKHPILIPRRSVLTSLIVADAHAATLHGGPQLMLTYLRSKFWILRAKDLVKGHVRRCVKCTRYSAITSTQMMGQLPAARVTPARPFKCSGVDYAGPINVRTSKGRGHHAYKGYICLFVCMATKAVHIEVVSDLTTQGFLAAFRRFVSRRGHCSDIWSDNGTNFVGASRELASLFSAEKSGMLTDIAQSLANNGTNWHFIPPLSPNFGGLWEAGVKSVKFHLKRVIGESSLTYEELATVLGQIEACLNSRPLSRVDTESEGFDALTPGHFLVGEPLLTVPDYNFESSNIGSLRRWQLTQRMMQTFWRRWSQEYLSTLVHRYKWSDQTPEPNVGDLVLIKEEDLPPARWLLGRVVVKHPGADNLTRVVSLRTKNSNVIKRPISKLCFLPVN